MNSITNEFEILDLSDHSGNSSNSDSSEITREFFQKEDLLKQSEINAPTTLGIYNYFMVPDIDYTNVTKLTLGCTSSIQCLIHSSSECQSLNTLDIFIILTTKLKKINAN